ncbi:MAG: hypothetical protein H0U95_15345 [Bacteroidetes bacterium]|nr:hypothetical protein [Bacteroidota bacterium]
MQQATEDHSTWQVYNTQENIREKIERYFKLLNEHLKNHSVKKLNEAIAKGYAKNFIGDYVHRGDTYESLAKSHMGAGNSEYRADIKQNKIIVSDANNLNNKFSFSLKTIYNELKNEKKVKTVKGKPTPNKPAPVRINYDHSKPYERVDDEIKFIKRYLALHGKSKTKAQMLSFINALQKAIVEKRIRKTSKYAAEIMQVQKQLVTAYEVMGNEHTFELGASTIKKFSDIVGSVRIRLSTQYLKRFVGIQGKNITKDKATRLLNVILDALETNKISKADPYYQSTMKIGNALNTFVEKAKEGETLEIHQQALNGLNGVLGCNCDCDCANNKESKKQTLTCLDGVDETPQVMSVEDVKHKKYNSVPLSDKWKALLGEICLPTHLFVYGSGGSGKTSWALLFTQHLATLGYKILYVAGEQFDTPPFTKLLNQLNIIAGDNYKIVGKLDTLNPADFDFVVLDTKDSLEIDTMQFLKLKEDFKQQSFIIVSHGIKTGEFKGKEQWRNIVDVMVYGENGTIRTGQDKNRWGGAGEMFIYDHENQYVIKE